MRSIVIGQLTTGSGIQTVNVWFRFPVPAARQAYYATWYGLHQPTPQAPGDYTATTGTDFAEVAQLTSGQWVEQAGFTDIIDPTSPLGTIQARLTNIYNASLSFRGTADTALLSRWGSSWDGTTWTMKAS